MDGHANVHAAYELKDTASPKKRSVLHTYIKGGFEVSLIDRARKGPAGGARKRSECRQTSKTATSMDMYNFLQHHRKVHNRFATDANMS